MNALSGFQQTATAPTGARCAYTATIFRCRCMITRFNGSSPKPVFQVSDRDLTGFWVVASVAQGFYSVALGGGATTSADYVIRIDPATGAVKVINDLGRLLFWRRASASRFDHVESSGLSLDASPTSSSGSMMSPSVLKWLPGPASRRYETCVRDASLSGR